MTKRYQYPPKVGSMHSSLAISGSEIWTSESQSKKLRRKGGHESEKPSSSSEICEGEV